MKAKLCIGPFHRRLIFLRYKHVIAGKKFQSRVIRLAGLCADGQIAVYTKIKSFAESFKACSDLIRVKASCIFIVVVGVYAISSASP